MPSRRSVPHIRIELLDGSTVSLSPSSTLDITEILNQAKPWPNLLAEDFALNDVDSAFCWEDGRLPNVPPFPMDHRPPLFILHSHRARLPFPIRQEAFELGDFLWDDEDASSLLTAPTMPRMKLMIKEQLYVQKWVNKLTSDNPPNHIPWSCEKPAAVRKWIAEGSLFPATAVRSEQCAVVQGHPCFVDAPRFSAYANCVSRPGELTALSEVPAPKHPSAASHAPTSHVPAKSADVALVMLRGEPTIPHPPHSIVETSQTSSPLALRPSGTSIAATPIKPQAPLAARRGKSIGNLKLKGSVIEQLEYPDIPTAFRGSSSVWSPRFNDLPVSFFTDHETMLLDLQLKSAALGNGVSTYVPEHPRPRREAARISLDVDEWMLTQDLATFDDVSGSIYDGKIKGNVLDTNLFHPNESSTSAKSSSFTAHLDISRTQLPIKRLGDPPGVPLPPRPALINPSTPPHVRGILKKVKSVRFEDMLVKESQGPLPDASSPEVSQEWSSPQPSVVSSDKPCMTTSNAAKSPTCVPPTKETIPGRNASKKSTPKPRPPPKRTKANGKAAAAQSKSDNASVTSKSTTTTPVERPCRIAHVKKNTHPNTVPLARAKQKGLSVTETDVRRGIEGTAKSRLSTPLRNIFRFR